tara:strand:+ start:50 stop:667 length:618 start_codon:yes stop_codon:yes gene_type:complete
MIKLKDLLTEISTKAGLEDVIKGRTSAIEGIKMSQELAQSIYNWIGQSPYGRKYNKHILKGRIHSIIGPANVFGIERYLDSKTKKEWKAIVAKHRPKRESVNESYNQSDVNYAMKMAFDSIPGNWHKALKRVKYSKRDKAIKLNMSSYMGPGKVLQKIVDEFNRSMGTKYKIDKDSFVKGSVTGIELRENKLNDNSYEHIRKDKS